MRILFWGSGDFAVPSLYALVDAGHAVPLVITQPDRPAGRGGELRQTPVKVAALELGLPVFQPESMHDAELVSRVSALEPDLSIIIAYGHRITPELLRIPRLGFMNAHASILPKYRGAAPVPHAIKNGEHETGVTFFQLAEKWDDGPVYDVVRTPIRSNDTALSVLERLSVLAAEALPGIVARLEDGSMKASAQDHVNATRAPKFMRDDGHIDWSRSSREIDCLVRAMQPWPEAFTVFPGKRGKSLRVHILAIEHEAGHDAEGRHHVPGTVLMADSRDGLVVATGDGAVRLTRIKPEGKKAMTGAEYLRGSSLVAGTQLDERGSE